MFTLTVFEILLSKGRPVLWPAQWGSGSEKIKVSVKNQKNIENLLKLLEKWLTYKLRRFWIVFNFFWSCLIPSVPEKLKNSIFGMLIIHLSRIRWRNVFTWTGTRPILTKKIKMLIASAKSRSVRGASHQPAFMSGCLTISHTCLPCLSSERM